MSRRPPKRPPARGTAETTNRGRTYGRVQIDAPEQTKTRSFTVDGLETGPAKIRMGLAKKHWGQHQKLELGMSVEAMCHVELCCAQDDKTMLEAAQLSASMAKEFAWAAAEEVKQELVDFLERTKR